MQETNVKVLYLGKHEAIRETMHRLLNVHWQGFVAASPAELWAMCREQSFDILLLGNGLDQSEEDDIRAVCTQEFPGMLLLQHYGGGSGLLVGEIQFALWQKRQQGG